MGERKTMPKCFIAHFAYSRIIDQYTTSVVVYITQVPFASDNLYFSSYDLLNHHMANKYRQIRELRTPSA